MLWVSGSAGYVAHASEFDVPEVRLYNVLDIKRLGLLQFGNNTSLSNLCVSSGHIVQVIFKGVSEMC